MDQNNLALLKKAYEGTGESMVIETVTPFTGGHPIHVSLTTGLVFVKDRRSEQEIAKSWSDEMYGTQISQTSYSAHNPMMKSRHIYTADYADSVVGLRGKRLMDFGAGEGQFLKIVREQYGAVPFGVEPSTKNGKLMNELDIPNFVGTISEFNSSPKNTKDFDVVTLMWTLCNVSSCYDVIQSAFDSLKEGGHIVVSESSRILVPFKKPIHTYFNPKVNQDLHPWHFSANNLRTLLELVGFEITSINRFFEQDNLVVVATKKKNPKRRFLVDRYQDILDFFMRWEKESQYFKHFEYEFNERSL